MRKNSSVFKKRGFVIGLFILLIGGISFGYAALSTKLTINGKTNIGKVGWDIHFFDASVTDGSADGTPANQIIQSDTTKAEWETTLSVPGDYYEFTINVGNFGTIDAKLGTLDDDATKKYIIDTMSAKYADDGEELSAEDKAKLDKLIKYTITGEPADKLGKATASGPTSYALTFRVEFDSDIDAEDLLTKAITLDYFYELKYVQDK